MFSTNNAKLSLVTASFSIPPIEKVCRIVCYGCYALRVARYPSVKKAWEENYKISQSPEFSDIAVGELLALKRKGIKYVRVHTSGEFYEQEYVNKWSEIAGRLDSLTFYVYTKNPWELDLSPLKKLPNFVLHEQRIPKNYGTLKEIEDIQAKYPKSFLCPYSKAREGECGGVCTWCMEKSNEETEILFEAH
jgi:hypothetical protein